MPAWLADIISNPDILSAFVVGFFAQMLDGSLGMGFGVLSYTLLNGIGLDPKSVSATVNASKIFTGTAASIAHVREGNVNKSMLLRLGAGGVAGALIGSLILVSIHSDQLKIGVNIYLLAIGGLILYRARRPRAELAKRQHRTIIALFGGILEALAGIWGPFVTSSLVERGGTPRYVVGTSTIAETIVAVTVTTVLVGNLGFAAVSQLALGLIAGALIASPIAAKLTKKLPTSIAIICIGLLVIVTSLTRLAQQLL
ncbi:sulfite exporter TauE/SafE family protein [Sandarakinorhabdus cyanobacteriorum]|nr:sulfite exporter TauE/SafE family protein [Sandarakinorhabdus cyanobacteriorum]